MTPSESKRQPLRRLEDWEDFVRDDVYPEPNRKSRSELRPYYEHLIHRYLPDPLRF